jgi:hypothetical protein
MIRFKVGIVSIIVTVGFKKCKQVVLTYYVNWVPYFQLKKKILSFAAVLIITSEHSFLSIFNHVMGTF